MTNIERRKRTLRRAKRLLARFRKGETTAAIARSEGITCERVGQLLALVGYVRAGLDKFQQNPKRDAVLQELMAGKTNHQISRKIGVSVNVAAGLRKRQIGSVMTKQEALALPKDFSNRPRRPTPLPATPRGSRAEQRERRHQRALAMSAKRSAGMKLREIAAQEGISIERVRQILAVAEAVETATPVVCTGVHVRVQVRPDWSCPDAGTLRLAHEARDEIRTNLAQRAR